LTSPSILAWIPPFLRRPHQVSLTSTPQMAEMHSYYGHVRSQLDAILLFEACRLGLLPRIRRRLSERERLEISSGKVYIWDEQEAGMRRWTDGKSWSASRVSGAFLSYREMDTTRRSTPEIDDSSSSSSYLDNSGKRSSESFGSPPLGSSGFSVITKRRKKAPATDDPNIEETEEGYRYKKNGLYKQSFSITTSTNLKLHLISYYCKDDLASGKLIQPCMDAKLKNIVIPVNLYPDAPPGGVAVPALTNVPLEPQASSVSTPTGGTSSTSTSPRPVRELKSSYSEPEREPRIKHERYSGLGISTPSGTENRPRMGTAALNTIPTSRSPGSIVVGSGAVRPPAAATEALAASAEFAVSSSKGLSLPPFVQARTELFAEDKRVISILDRALLI
jgi:hypothetical protein